MIKWAIRDVEVSLGAHIKGEQNIYLFLSGRG